MGAGRVAHKLNRKELWRFVAHGTPPVEKRLTKVQSIKQVEKEKSK